MRIGRVSPAAYSTAYGRRPDPAPCGAPAADSDTADTAARTGLPVPLAPRAPGSGIAAPRSGPSSAFLAQLLANRIGLAQARRRRRAGPQDSAAHYRAADGLGRDAAAGGRRDRRF